MCYMLSAICYIEETMKTLTLQLLVSSGRSAAVCLTICDFLVETRCLKVKRIRGAIENVIRFQYDPIQKVANFSEKTFSKETFQLLNSTKKYKHFTEQ